MIKYLCSSGVALVSIQLQFSAGMSAQRVTAAGANHICKHRAESHVWMQRCLPSNSSRCHDQKQLNMHFEGKAEQVYTKGPSLCFNGGDFSLSFISALKGQGMHFEIYVILLST